MIKLKNGSKDTIIHTIWRQRIKKIECVLNVRMWIGNRNGIIQDGVKTGYRANKVKNAEWRRAISQMLRLSDVLKVSFTFFSM